MSKEAPLVKLEIAKFVAAQQGFQVYGGFAREAMRAQLCCQRSLITFVLGEPFGPVVTRRIARHCWATRFDDLSWFENPEKENLNDIDILVDDLPPVHPLRPDYLQPLRTDPKDYVAPKVKILRELLNHHLAPMNYTSSTRQGGGPHYPHTFDVHCRRVGETSHTAGDFEHWTLIFHKVHFTDSDDFYLTRIYLDLIYMLKADWLDMSINGLIFYYDFAAEHFKFRSRKKNISLASIVEDIEKKQFHEYPLPPDKEDERYQHCLIDRCRRMEKRGWKWVNKNRK